MTSAASMVRDQREAAGLSLRALADAAGVSFTTVHRIERGDIDPGFETLRKILNATGHDLELVRDELFDLAALADRWERNELGDRPDWPTYRGWIDRLQQHPAWTRAAIAKQPPPSGSPLIDNLLAALAEKLSDDAHVRRPTWTSAVSPLPPSVPDRSPSWRRPHQRVPDQFMARGLNFAEDSLWRDRG